MTPQTAENIEIVKGIYAAFAKGDAPAVLARIAPDVDWEPGYSHNSDIPWLKSGRGPAHVGAFLGELQRFDFKQFDLVSVMGDGPWVVALTALHLVDKKSGRAIIEPCEPHVWKLDHGRVVAMRHAADTRAHARVAGV